MITLEEYDRNSKENVENQFKSYVNLRNRRKLSGNQIERLPAEVFKNNSELAFLKFTSKH